uniref:Ftr1 protein n=1 Tax=Mycena chlorophos TaxID=658473 RepID=A0ABQ0M041_MYCCL|nr:Ftr1 protein [Mycena chlorophos]
MGKNLFSIPIFFIVFRETLEAAIIVSVLLGLAEQIVYEDPSRFRPSPTSESSPVDSKDEGIASDPGPEDDPAHRRALIRKLRIQIFAGAGLGLFLALAIGALRRHFRTHRGAHDLRHGSNHAPHGPRKSEMARKTRSRVLKTHAHRRVHQSMEAVIFVGGVSLGQPATSIPIATIVGLICGILVGLLIYTFASRTTLSVFLIAMTNLLLLIGAGLFSRAVWSFQENAFNNLLGADVDDSGGDGPGSFRVQGNVWHLDCCNPEDDIDGQGWSIFNALFGWTNSATIGSVLAYVFYWIAVIITLIFMKFQEGRTKLLGKESAVGARRRIAREQRAAEAAAAQQLVVEEEIKE